MTAAVVGGAGRDWDEEDERDVTAPIVNCFERMPTTTTTRGWFAGPPPSGCHWDTSSVSSQSEESSGSLQSSCAGLHAIKSDALWKNKTHDQFILCDMMPFH